MNIKLNRKQLLAYTLIELLFIVVIIGVIASIGLTAYLQKTTNIKVEKTALQLQQMLQAANAYDGATGNWPNRASCTTPPPEDFIPYIPVNTQNSPWGQCYTYGLDSSQQFQVAVSKVPSSAAATIASLLPNAAAQCSGSLCTITANIGGSAIGLNIKVIKTVYNLNDNTLINPDPTGTTSESFTCPSGWTAATTTLLAGITPRDTDSLEKHKCSAGIYGGQGSLMVSYLGATPITCIPQGFNKYTCPTYSISQAERPDPKKLCAAFFTDNLGPQNVTYISYCVPPQSQQATQPVRY